MARKFFYVCAGLFLLALAYHIGANNAGAQIGYSQEVAMRSGQVANGGTIPLPRYQDGTEALESECQWSVSIANVPGHPDAALYVSRMECFTEGRTVRAFTCTQGNCGHGFDPRSATANYIIIAIRNTSPIPIRSESLGQVKARYR